MSDSDDEVRARVRAEDPNLDQSVSGGPQNQIVEVHEVSDVGSARRTAARIARSAGLPEAAAGNLALVVTEAATNIARHARDGSIILRALRNGDSPCVEMIAIDNGDGIADLSKAMGDGFSSGGTQGHGLSAIKRNSVGFDIWSSPGAGTAVVARFMAAGKDVDRHFQTGVVCTAIAGETACGDSWAVEETRGGTLYVIADGLGHGPDAAVASGTALSAIRSRKGKSTAELFSVMHGALKSTRGAAIQIAVIDRAASSVRSIGVGNIATFVTTLSSFKGLASQPGIVGHQLPTPREIAVPWQDGALLIMHSDGLSARWKLESYPGLRFRDPALIAAVLYRDFARERDDATVIVSRGEMPGGNAR